MKPAKEIRIVLGDQLNAGHSWFKNTNDEVVYLLMEMRQETDYVRHHVQKVLAFFLAMRHFADELKQSGHRVHYIRLDDAENEQDILGNLKKMMEETGARKWAHQLPDEYRLDGVFKQVEEELGPPVDVSDTEHFLTKRDDLAAFFEGKKTFLMESFYRHMRRKYGVMMEGSEPATGRWNYDAENRKKLPKAQHIPAARSYSRDVTECLDMLSEAKVDTIGHVNAQNFVWPVTRQEGLDLLNHFIEHLLPYFGAYQDAMTTRDWSLFHSRLSFAMNVKLLSPLEVIQRVEQAWEDQPERYGIAQVEGFIRQILGWREYMRGIYWAKMPEYASMNYFGHSRRLPAWFWTGETNMKCLSHAVGQSLDHAYAHHIQRLMVTGNFALLAGVDPDEVDAWYLGIYIDALEWVEITNTRGMSQFADGGIVGTKPYVSSANYMHKMGDYCSQCVYDKKQKTGEGACPFNSLYWHFYARNRGKLEKNPRIGMMYRTWDKMDSVKQRELLDWGDEMLARVDNL